MTGFEGVSVLLTGGSQETHGSFPMVAAYDSRRGHTFGSHFRVTIRCEKGLARVMPADIIMVWEAHARYSQQHPHDSYIGAMSHSGFEARFSAALHQAPA